MHKQGEPRYLWLHMRRSELHEQWAILDAMQSERQSLAYHHATLLRICALTYVKVSFLFRSLKC